MKPYLHFLFAVAITLPMLPVGTHAHFQLLEPASWLEENQLGDPQKLGPCGGDPGGENEELLTGAITEVTGGSELHLKVQETIFHSGHYRVALAVNSACFLRKDSAECPAEPSLQELARVGQRRSASVGCVRYHGAESD